ncbi:MAG TPA: type II secretion system protein GspG [Planctomycetota bacterium]|nr:type II secretion system protein GspG [Planctomycetota bacterium]
MKPIFRLVLGSTAVGLVVSLLLPNRMVNTFEAMHELARMKIEELAGALEIYAAEHGGSCPTSLDALRSSVEEQSWLEQFRVDPWNRPYFYVPSPDGRSWRLSSLGSDGKPGGSGDARDLVVESK